MPVVELSFPVRGTPLPVDNGYLVYRAVARAVPWVGEPAQMELAVVPVQGNPHRGFLDLTPTSRLAFRLNADDAPMLLPLADQCLVLDGMTLILGKPTTSDLRPAPSLMSMFVVAERCRHSDEVQEWLETQSRALDIRSVPTLRRKRNREQVNPTESDRDSYACPYVRRYRHVGDNAVVGWEVQVRGLAPGESVRLQEHGIGPGRRYSCGVFVPDEGGQPRPASRRDATAVWFPET